MIYADKKTKEDKRLSIVRDLMLDLPKGPGPSVLEYDKIILKDAVRHRPKLDNFGYDPKVIFSLGIRSYSSCRDTITKIVCGDYYDYYDKANVTDENRKIIQEKTPTVWSRLCSAVWKVQRDGGDGIYRVYSSGAFFDPPLGFIYSKNKQDAQDCCSVLFSGLSNNKNNMKIEFYAYGNVEIAIEKNKEILLLMSSSVATDKKNVESISDRILKYETAAQRLETILDVQLAGIKKRNEQSKE